MTMQTHVERTSDRELTVTRRFNGPARLVFQAWSTPELFVRWWVPKSSGMTLVSHDMELMTVCDLVHVLYFGEIITSSDMDGIKNNARVREVYLGV